MEASLLSTTIDGSAYDVIQISNANSGSTPGGNADAAIKTVYVYTPDGVDNGVATYEGTVWPYVTYSQDASTIVVPDSITATFTVNSESHVLINNQPVYQYAGDDAGSDVNGNGNGGVWYAIQADGTSLEPDPTPTPAPSPRPEPAAIGCH